MPKAVDAIKEALDERGKNYGDFDHMSAVAQAIKNAMRASNNWDKLPGFVRETLDMTATKISRIVCGNWSYEDSYFDIAGYATRCLQSVKQINRVKIGLTECDEGEAD